MAGQIVKCVSKGKFRAMRLGSKNHCVLSRGVQVDKCS